MKLERYHIPTILLTIAIFVGFFYMQQNLPAENKEYIAKGQIVEVANDYFIFDVDPQNKKLANISDYKIENNNGETFVLGKAVSGFTQADLNEEKTVIINSPSRIVVSKNASPLGVSFRENICTGFLNQYQDFNPSLDENCPSAINILNDAGIDIDGTCRSFVETIPNCRIVTSFPDNLDKSCVEIVGDHINYNKCVASTIKKVGFESDTWRYFINDQNIDFLDQRRIKIFDENFNLLDSKVF